MIYVQFLMGMLVYLILAVMSYSPTMKAHPYYYAAGAVLAVISNFAWMWLSKTTQNPSDLVVRGVYWDLMLMASYMSVPFLAYGAKLNSTQLIGIGLIVAGLVIMKVSEI